MNVATYVVINGIDPVTQERNTTPMFFETWNEAIKWVHGVPDAKYKKFQYEASIPPETDAAISKWIDKQFKKLGLDKENSEPDLHVPNAFELHCWKLNTDPKKMTRILQDMFCNIVDLIEQEGKDACI